MDYIIVMEHIHPKNSFHYLTMDMKVMVNDFIDY